MCTKVIQEENVGDTVGRVFSRWCEIHRLLLLLLGKVIHHVEFHHSIEAIVVVVVIIVDDDAIVVLLLVRHAGRNKSCPIRSIL